MAHIRILDESAASEREKQDIIKSFRKLSERITNYYVSRLSNTSKSHPLEVDIALDMDEYETINIDSIYAENGEVYIHYDIGYDYFNLDELDLNKQLYIMGELF